MVSLVALHPMRDFKGPNHDFLARTLYENMFSEGLAYALILDKNGDPILALDPEKIVSRIPQPIHMKARYSMGLTKRSMNSPSLFLKTGRGLVR